MVEPYILSQCLPEVAVQQLERTLREESPFVRGAFVIELDNETPSQFGSALRALPSLAWSDVTIELQKFLHNFHSEHKDGQWAFGPLWSWPHDSECHRHCFDVPLTEDLVKRAQKVHRIGGTADSNCLCVAHVVTVSCKSGEATRTMHATRVLPGIQSLKWLICNDLALSPYAHHRWPKTGNNARRVWISSKINETPKFIMDSELIPTLVEYVKDCVALNTMHATPDWLAVVFDLLPAQIDKETSPFSTDLATLSIIVQNKITRHSDQVRIVNEKVEVSPGKVLMFTALVGPAQDLSDEMYTDLATIFASTLPADGRHLYQTFCIKCCRDGNWRSQNRPFVLALLNKQT